MNDSTRAEKSLPEIIPQRDSEPSGSDLEDGSLNSIHLSHIERDSPGPSYDKTETEAAQDLDALERVGQRIGEYHLTKEIGEGTFGVVFQAEQYEPIRRQVALKILKPGMDSRHILARFRREHRVLALIDHPSVATVFDAGLTPTGRPYFAMELVNGQPITDYSDAARLTLSQRLKLFSAVCDAVQHAHSKGIVHRDLKPQNILVVRDGACEQVKIVDFGVAQVVGKDSSITSCSNGQKEPIGTPGYMSPEQTAGDHAQIDSRSDVYSLGVLLYELLTGTTPIPCSRNPYIPAEDDSNRTFCDNIIRPSECVAHLASDARNAIALARSTPARHLAQQIHRELDWIVMKALEVNPARRYETARGLRDDVQRHIRGDLVQARPPSFAYVLQKRFQRGRATGVLRASLIVVSVLCVLIAWLLYREVDHRYRMASLRDLQIAANASWDSPDLEASRQLYEEVQTLQHELLGDGNPTTWWTQVHISEIHRQQQQFRQAVELGEEAYKMLLVTQGADGPYTKHCGVQLVNSYLSLIWQCVSPDPAERVEPLENVPMMVERATQICRDAEEYGYYLPGHRRYLMKEMAWYYALTGNLDRLESIDADLQAPSRTTPFMFWIRAFAHQTVGQPDLARKCLAIAQDYDDPLPSGEPIKGWVRAFVNELERRAHGYLGVSPEQQQTAIPPTELLSIYTDLMKVYPVNPSLFYGRGVNYARCNDWQKAAEDFSVAAMQRPDVFEYLEALAIAQYQIQEFEDYRSTCQSAVERFSFSSEYENRLLGICLLAPECAMDPETIQIHLRDAAPPAPLSSLAYYRLGDYQRALESLVPSDSPVVEFFGMPIESMIHYRCGSQHAAARLLRRAQEKIDEQLSSSEGAPIAGTWFAKYPLWWAIIISLQNEAEDLIQSEHLSVPIRPLG